MKPESIQNDVRVRPFMSERLLSVIRMTDSDDIERRVRLAFFEERQRQRDRRWSRAQTIAAWLAVAAATASPFVAYVLAH